LRKRLQDVEVIDISDSDEPKPKISRVEVAEEEEKSRTIAAATIVKVEKQKVRKRTAGMASHPAISAKETATVETTSSSSTSVCTSPVASKLLSSEVLHTVDSLASGSSDTTSDEVYATPGSESTGQYSDLDSSRPYASSSGNEIYNILDVVARERVWPASEFWLCPLSKKTLQDAVVAADGHSYEREHIERYMAGKFVVLSPVTGLQLPHLLLTPNVALKSAISQMRQV
jgi:hypothetical protein